MSSFMKDYEPDDIIVRKVPELENVSEEDFKEIVLNNQYELLENELKLLDLGVIGMNVDELDARNVSFLLNFLDNEIYNPHTNRKTKSDIMNSFIMVQPNHDTISESIWNVKQENIGSEDYPKYKDVVTIKDFALFQKWKLRAIKHWNSNKLDDYTTNMKTLLEGKLDRAEILKDVIFDDAISNEVSEKTKLDSRKHMIDILGLKKERANNEVNVFHSGGGKDLVDSLGEFRKGAYDIYDADFQEIGDDDE